MNGSYLLTEKTVSYKDLLEFINSGLYRDFDSQIYICNDYDETRFLIAEYVGHFTNNEDIDYLGDRYYGYWSKITKRQEFKIFTDLNKLYPLRF